MRGRRTEPRPDTLPPHDLDAEAAVLGCVLLDNRNLEKARERFQGKGQAFYDLRHREILAGMCRLEEGGKPIDVITLKDALGPDLVVACGGIVYLAGLPERAISGAHIEQYLEIVWKKYLERLKLAEAAEIERVVRERGLNEADIARLDERHAEWKRLSQAGTVQPTLWASPADYNEEFCKIWFRKAGEEPGYKLAVPLADLRVRSHELIVFTAENGAGKSTYLGQLAVYLGVQGAKVGIASLEEHVPETMVMLGRQLIGAETDRLDETDANYKRLAAQVSWMQQRFRFYDYLGIGNWREILDCFRYARATLGYDVFILDSFMKIGVPDDDYSGQSVAVNAMADFCLGTGAALILVVHQNKAEGGYSQVKRKVRGAGTLTDVANVLMSIRRNEKKEEQLAELWEEQQAEERILSNPNASEEQKGKAKKEIGRIRDERVKLREVWDSEVRLLKQRKKGTQQNASRKLWFDRWSLQFRGSPGDSAVNYLALTPKTRATEKNLTTRAEDGAGGTESTETNQNERQESE